MKRLSVILASGTLAMSAQAVNWIELSKTNSGSVFSIDTESIESSDIQIIDEKSVDNVTVSIRITYPQSKSEGNKTVIAYCDQQLLLSCKDASYYKRAYVNYDSNDKVIKSWQSDKPILTSKDFKLTSPNTIARKIVDQTCKKPQSVKP